MSFVRTMSLVVGFDVRTAANGGVLVELRTATGTKPQFLLKDKAIARQFVDGIPVVIDIGPTAIFGTQHKGEAAIEMRYDKTRYYYLLQGNLFYWELKQAILDAAHA